MSEAERSEYCRRNGLYPERIDRWRSAWERANDWERSQFERLARHRREQRRRIAEFVRF